MEQHCCGDRPDSLPEQDDEGEGDEDVPGIGQGRDQPVEHVLSQRLILDVLCGWLHLGAEEHLTYACRGSMLLKSGMPLLGTTSISRPAHYFACRQTSACWLQALLCNHEQVRLADRRHMQTVQPAGWQAPT